MYKRQIYSVLKSLDPYHSRSFGNAAIVLERWKAVQSNRENERIEKGYYSDRPYIEEFCCFIAVSYTHLRAHESPEHLVCRLLLEKKKNTITHSLIAASS